MKDEEGEEIVSCMVVVTEKGKLEVCRQVKSGHDTRAVERLKKYMEMLGEKVCLKQKD